MNKTEHLLTCLAEEGAEIGQDVSKILRFGLDDLYVKKGGDTNRERLITELNDLLGVCDLLVDVGVLPAEWANPAKQDAKYEKVIKYMNYSKERGTLE